MKNNTIFKLFIIIIIALLFRLWFIDKPEGLWNDEYVSWYIASTKGVSSFLAEMLKNCHTPLYYIYLKLWMLIFPDTDLSLRISSVVLSLISIIIMFISGKELKDINAGFLAAFLTAISSFHIYFAQEVRLYSLLFLVTSVSVLFFIKTVKKQSKFNLFSFFCAHAFICAAHTLGIVYSFFNICSLFLFLYKYNEQYKNKIQNLLSKVKSIFPFCLVILILLPFLFSIVFSNSLSQFWSQFSFSKILFTFIDYFSPVQTNIINSPNTFSTYLYSETGINFIFIIFAVVPCLIAFSAIIKAILNKNIILNYLLMNAALFFITIILISLSGKIILLTKYSCEMYPILILTISYGFLTFNNKLLKRLLILLFLTLNLFYLCSSSDAAPKRTRPEGHLAVVELLKNSRLKKKDYVLLTYYDVDKFERYLPSKRQYKFKSINKFNFNYYMYNNDNYHETIKLGKTLYKDYFHEFPNHVITEYTKKNFTDKMKKGELVGIIFLNTVSFLSNDNIQEIINDEHLYKNTPFIFLSFSALRNNLLLSFKEDYKIDSITQAGDWSLFVFEKIN